MEAIQLNGAMHLHRYACQSINISPNPPHVGEVTTLALAFKNAGAQAITIKRIQFMVAAFGMGIGWEKLPLIEHLLLPANPGHVTEVAIQWTPTQGGHRCVRVTIESDILPQPLRIGRNLDVIHSAADKRAWQIPFRLGNPEDARMPLMLELGGDKADGVEAHILLNGQLIRAEQTIWLSPREELDARLLLHARTEEAIRAVKTVEARIQGRFIDGIQVEVYRPAYSNRYPLVEPERERELATEHHFGLAVTRAG